MFKHWISTTMKIHKYAVIIFSLFLPMEGMNVIEKSVQEGETFIFHLPNEESDISSVEWKQMDKNRLLAHICLDNANKTLIFSQKIFMQNGSIIIRDFKQEDTGNYTCKIIYKNNKIETYIISLTLYSEQSPTQSSIPTTSDAQTLYIVLIPVIGGLLLLGSVMVIVVKCRKKRSTQDEHIYYNITHKSKGNPETRQEKGQM